MMAVSSLTEPSVPPVPEGGGSDDLMSDFVVLPRSPNDDCFMLDAGAGNGPLDQLKLSLPHDDRTSLSSASDDLTHQEAEERIAKVLKENVTLKEKVAQSTAKIHQQLEAFVSWQRQLQAAHQAQRQELEETRRLFDEKSALASQLMEHLSKLDVSTMDTSSCEPVPGLLPNKDRGEMSQFQLVKELHDEHSKTARLTGKVDELTEKLAAKTLESEQLQETVAKLTVRLAEAESRSSALSAQATSRQAELETSLLEKEALVRALQGQCEAKVAELEELRRALLAAEKNSDRARRDYAELLRTWQEFENSNEGGEFVRVEAPPGQTAAALRESEQARRQELAEQKKQVTALRQELEELRQQAELLPPLRAQVEVFRTDYTTERNLRRELEQRVQEHLSTIEELRAHIRTLQAAEPSNNTAQQRSTENSLASAQPQSAESPLSCPLCMEACSTRSIYIAHVQSCADGQEVR